VEFSPGGCDDGSGVVILLELLSNLINDLTITFTNVHLIVLLTNGEETDLLGARAFITNHPWRFHVHRFINVDSISCKEMAELTRIGSSEVAFRFFINLVFYTSFLFL
jgi:Zn-dependent M28 family amino/carboxypeptidase